MSTHIGLCHTTWSICHLTVTMILLIIVICFICVYVQRSRNKRQNGNEIPKSSNISLLIVSISTVLWLICDGLEDINCLPTISDIYALLIIALYFIQLYALTIFFYLRMYIAFNSSPFRLSKVTKTSYAICFMIIAVCILSTIILVPVDHQLAWKYQNLLGSIAAAILILLDLSLLALFVSKLATVIHMDHSDDDGGKTLLCLITKTTILKLISSLMTLTNCVAYEIRYRSTSHHTRWIHSFLWTFDAFSNFLCVILSVNVLNDLYEKLCICIDNRCKLCCHQCVGKERKVTNRSGSDIKLTL
eukprot:23937_1